MSVELDLSALPSKQVTRRKFIEMAGMAGLAAGPLASLVACSTSSTTSSHSAVSMLAWDFQPPVIKQHISAFEKEFGATVNLSIIPNNGYQAAILTRFQGGQSYDVYYNFAQNSNKFFTNGWAKPLGKLPGADQVLADMFPASRAFYQNASGQLISLPYYSAAFITMYNQSHLQKAGISAPPQTFQELYDQCKKIKASGITATPFTAYWIKRQTEESFVAYLLAGGVTPFDQKGAPVFADDPKSVTILEWWRSMFQDKLVQPTILTDIIDQEVPLMANGKATFLQAGHYWLKSIRTQAGSESANVVMSYKMPGAADSSNKSLVQGDVLQMGSTSNPDAWSLAKFYGYKDPKTNVMSTFESWAQAASLAAPYPAFFQDSNVRTNYGSYYDMDKLQTLFQNSDPLPTRILPWYAAFQVNVGDRIHAMLLGQASPAATIQGLASDAKAAASGG
jgi:multiple sugar transport system substrate-binding protein